MSRLLLFRLFLVAVAEPATPEVLQMLLLQRQFGRLSAAFELLDVVEEVVVDEGLRGQARSAERRAHEGLRLLAGQVTHLSVRNQVGKFTHGRLFRFRNQPVIATLHPYYK